MKILCIFKRTAAAKEKVYEMREEGIIMAWMVSLVENKVVSKTFSSTRIVLFITGIMIP